MKQRMLSAVIGISLTVVILCFYQTIVLNIAVAVVSAIAVFEIMQVTKVYANQKEIFFICEVFAISLPFLGLLNIPNIKLTFVCIYLVVMLLSFLKHHSTLKIGELSFVSITTLMISFSLSTLVSIRDNFQPFSMYYIFLLFFISWICDAGAYIFGRALGKHKLAPKISPNKTIEGLIGGVVTNIIFVFILTVVFETWFLKGASFNYGLIATITILGSFVGVLGDLSASIIKRQYGIKDFGNILPGHGGAVDRFDSWMLVALVFYPTICYFPLIS